MILTKAKVTLSLRMKGSKNKIGKVTLLTGCWMFANGESE